MDRLVIVVIAPDGTMSVAGPTRRREVADGIASNVQAVEGYDATVLTLDSLPELARWAAHQ